MGLVEKQMRDGARLHQSLLDETVRHASLIRGMVENFDSDPRVLDAVDLLDEKIASLAARGIESVRDNRTQRDEIARAANAVGQILTDVGNAESPLSASIADTPTQSISADDVVLGEMLDDLMNN